MFEKTTFMFEKTTLFEEATRMKLRFPHKGMCSVEDLWDLPLKELDAIFKTLNKQIKTVKEESLLAEQSTADKMLTLQIKIVKYIVSVRLVEAENEAIALVNKIKKQKALDELANREDDSLKKMSTKKLKELVKKL